MAYHKLSSVVMAASGRPPVLLDESMARPAGGVREAVRAMKRAVARAREAAAFVPARDMKGIERIVVVRGQESPELRGAELVVGPDVAPEPLLRLFGRLAHGRLSPADAEKWAAAFQRDENRGKRVVVASDASDRFVEAYVTFHIRPRALRAESPATLRFFEGAYGKREDQLWAFMGG
jgi:hypothetical protein